MLFTQMLGWETLTEWLSKQWSDDPLNVIGVAASVITLVIVLRDFIKDRPEVKVQTSEWRPFIGLSIKVRNEGRRPVAINKVGLLILPSTKQITEFLKDECILGEKEGLKHNIGSIKVKLREKTTTLH